MPPLRSAVLVPRRHRKLERRNAEAMATIEARGLRKAYGTTIALDGVDLRVEEGRILGLIGPNGAGKTTALNAILGLTSYEGELKVLGRDPWAAREELMRDVSFIADVAVLPRWIRVSQLLDYVAGVHPKFDRAKAEGFLEKTTIKRMSKVRQLSKGMVAQLHLALVMAIDAKLLVLDEPTLGLDILYRKQFYDSLLNDYFDRSRTIVVTTHQVEEVQDVLTDVMFINRGRIVFDCSMEEFESRYLEVMVNPEHRRLVCCRTQQSKRRGPRRDSMSTPSNTVPGSPLELQVTAPAVITASRRMYWSVRRELWEHRSIYVAPLTAAAVFLLAFLTALTLSPVHRHEPLDILYEFAAALIMGTGFIVGIFYSLDALYGERRDRSILFWKSLPVSDLTTVLSKFAIPLVILPLLSFAIAVVTQFVMLLLSSAFLLGSGLSVGTLGARMSFFHMSLMLLYHILTVHGLWYAPIYGWLLLVSAWAPRAPFIWAFLPPFVIWGVEKIAFSTSHFLGMLQYRLTGPEPSTTTARSGNLMEMMSALTPVQFFSTPGLWVGLAVAAIFLAAAVRLRRYREPI